MAPDNKSLGRFILDGIPPAPRGTPQIEVIFDIDANGILTVTAKDKATSKSQNITIQDSSKLSKEDIEKMKAEAEKFSAADRQRKELVEVRNTADNMMYTAEKTLRDAGEKAPEAMKKEVEEKVAALRKIKDADDSTAIKKATEELSQSLQKIGAEMYKAQGPQAGASGSTGEAPKGNTDDKPKDGPVEGEFEEKDKKK
jgi:molecular chaperone DnaK